MDLINYTPKSDTVEVILTNPNTGEIFVNDDGSEMSITVWAPHSKPYKEASYDFVDEKIAQGNKNFTARELDEKSLRLLSKITKEWDITFSGEKPELTEEKAREVYERVFWIKGQVEKAIDESVVFTVD